MRHLRPAHFLLATLTTTLAVGAALVVPAQAAAPTVDLQPQKLTRGADIAVPHIDAGDFVDGARRVELPGTVARIIGRSGDAWLVGTSNVDRNRNRRVVRVEPDGTVADVLRNIDPSTVILSADGSTVAWQAYVSKGRKVITHAARAADGTSLGTKGPSSPASLLDVDSSKVLIAGRHRTFTWSFTTGRSRTVVSKQAGAASFEHDLLTTYTTDAYLGGCTRLVRLSDPSALVWKSCRDRVAAISPDGQQMLTFDILTDGIGPREIHLRTIGGARLATWTTNWFSSWEWESPTTVLLDVNGRRKFATVRCDLGDCENATDPVKVSAP